MIKKIFAFIIIGIVSVCLIGASVAGISQVSIYAWSGTQNRPLALDKYTRAIATIDYAHHEVHDGDDFFVSYYDDDVDSAQTVEILVVTPDTTKWGHFRYRIRSTLVTTLQIYEGTTTTNDGTGLTEWNADRNSATAATLALYHTPTVAGGGDGTLIFSDKWGIASGQQVRVGGESAEFDEIILDQNRKYLIRLTSGTNDNVISVKCRWYEHTNKTP